MEKIQLEIKKGDKVIKTKDIELKELNIWDELKFNDLVLEHTKKSDSDLFYRSGQLVQLCTGLTDEELAEMGAEGILKLFPLIIKAKSDKKKGS